jgi:hypothetical protein
MRNKAARSATQRGNTQFVPQLNVRPFPEELLRRISSVAGAKGQTQKEFVIEALDRQTKEYKDLVQQIYKREKTKESV